MVEATFEQAYPIAVRAAKVRARAAVVSGAIPVADREDFEQEGLTACWRALPQFDPGRASLRTFIERVIASRISSSNSLRTNPWGHQREAVDFVRQLRGRGKRGAMIAAAMGTGKSAVTVYLCAEEGFQLILVLCPLRVV